MDYGGVIAPGGGNFLKCARSLGDAPYKRGPRERHLICAEPELFKIDLTCGARLDPTPSALCIARVHLARPPHYSPHCCSANRAVE